MSVPARSGAWMSAMAEVRVNRGSAWISLAPASFACMTKRKPTGWHSAMFEPMIRTASANRTSIWFVVAPPRPSEVPRPGTVELCQIRAWFSSQIRPSARQSLSWT